jgi:murein DD-endopeptidase MepM/ murein hydrolase activator NlpD
MCPALILIALWLLLSVGVAAQSGEGDDPNVTIHVVQRGENLYRIALKYGLTLDEIARVNSLANPSNIQVGQRLLIPLTPSPVIVPPTTHTVQPGDNLQSIAALYSVEVQTLVLLNGIANPNALFVGQVLTIRPEEEFSGPPPTPTPTPPPVIAQSGGADDAGVTTSPQHVIQRGETLFTIAQRYGITTAELQAANDIADPSLIYAGQSLRIPGVEAPPSAVQLPPAITAIDITPLIWAAGGTGRVRLTTPPGSTVNATFLDRSLPVIAEEAGARHTLFVGVPLTAGGGIYPLALVITSPAGLTEFAFNVQVDAGAYGTQYITLPADKAALATQAVEENEYNILRDLMSAFTAERYFDGPMGLPAAAPMNARFGSRRVYNGSTFTSYHNGADFAGAMGTPVLAAAPGRVVLADTFNVRGLSLILDHGWGVYTVYSHMSQRYANLGEFVGTGQTIGLIGSSGRATGAHLHWELWVNGTPVDPMQWVAQAFP